MIDWSRFAQVGKLLQGGGPREQISELINRVAEGQDLGTLRKPLEQWLATVQGWESELRAGLAAVDEFEAKVASRRLYSTAWWGMRRRDVEELLKARPQDGMVELLRDFADTIVAGEDDVCRRIAGHDWPLPAGTEDVITTMRWLADAVGTPASSALPHLLERVARLAGPAGEPWLDPPRQAALFVLSGRVLLFQGYPDHAPRRFEAAAARAPGTALTHTALGDLHRSAGRTEEALSEYRDALEDSRSRPDTFIGLGQIAETSGVATEAREWYETAARAVIDSPKPQRALGAMLPQVPGGASFGLALRLQEERPDEALAAIEAATSAGLGAASGFKYSEAHVMRAELLMRAGRQLEAARAHSDAGFSYMDENEPERAAAELRSAVDLDPTLPAAQYGLSESLRLQSYLPNPQEADQERLREALQCWWRGYELRAVAPEDAWFYNVVGLIVDELGRHPASPDPAAVWEAIDWIERGIVVTDAAGQAANDRARVHLGRLYTNAGLAACALEITAEAVMSREPDSSAWWWHAAALANWGRYGEASAALDRAATEDPVEREIRTFLRLRQGDLGGGIAELDRMIEESEQARSQDPDVRPNLWALEQRAEYRGRGGDVEGSRADYESVAASYDPARRLEWPQVAYAAYRVGRLAHAKELLTKLIDDPSGDAFMLRFTLAMCELRLGNAAVGERLALEALRWPHAPRVLEELRIDAEAVASDASVAQGSRSVAARLVLEIERLHEAGDAFSPERELQIMLGTHGSDPAVAAAVSIALGRTHRMQARWPEAAQAYADAQAARPGGIESAAGMRAVLADLVRHLQQQSAGGARPGAEEWAAGREIAERHLPDEPAMQATLAACEEAALILDGRAEAGLEAIGAAVTAVGGEAEAVGSAIASACGMVSTGPSDLWRIRQVLAERGDREPSDDNPWRHAVESADRAIQEQTGLAGGSPVPADLRPVVRIGEALVPEDTGPQWILFTHYLPALRARVESDTGVTGPGIFFRRKPGDLGSGYEIVLDGIVQASGEVELGRRFSPAPPQRLSDLGIPAERLIEAPDPVTGKLGAWIAEDDWERVTDGVELWEEPLLFVVRHLEAVLRANLADFIDADRVELVLDRWSHDPEAARRVEELFPGSADRIRFGRLLRSLASEMVPIVDWHDVLAPLGRGPFGDRPIGEALEAIRRQAGARLPGCDPSLRRVSLLQTEVEEIAEAARGGRRWEGAGLPAAASALDRILARHQPLDAGTALVAPDAASRTLIRQLTSVIAPQVPVVAAAELDRADAAAADQSVAQERAERVA